MGPFRRMAGLAAPIACLLSLVAAGPAAAAFVYVGDGSGGGQLWQFGQDPTGAVSPLAPANVDDGGMSALGVVSSADVKSLYVAENGVATGIYEFDIAKDGTVTPKATPMIAFDGALATPIGADLAVTPNGKSLYASDLSGLVWQFSIDSSGNLSHKSTPNVAGGIGTAELAVSPDGHHLYALQNKSGATSILQFDIGSSGSLKAKDPPSAPLPGANAGVGLVVSPDGTSVYATGNNDQIYQFDVAVDGSLTPKAQPSVGTGYPLVGPLAISPDGTNLYAGAETTGSCTTGSGQILHYAVGPGGQLSAVDTIAAAPAGSGERDLAVSADGASVYASESCSLGATSGLREFDVGAGGSLTPKATPFFPTGPSASDLALTPAKHYKVSVAAFGSSPGSVSGSGIVCPNICAQRYLENTTITLTATPTPGGKFVVWGGPCNNTDPTCTFILQSDQSVSATFLAKPPPPHCRLTARISRAHRLVVDAVCDDNARATVTGTIRLQRGRSFALHPASGHLDAYTDKFLSLRLPAAVLAGLGRGQTASATLRLRAKNANGTGRVTARVRRLHE